MRTGIPQKKSKKQQNVKKVLSILNFFTHFAVFRLENGRKIAYICLGTFFKAAE
ncbi:MAG: hypothetical protein J6S19_00920 [Lentisphaeria bacterium]|nr:hypothetical protein [Lentisphaeria bacterium]